MYNAPIQQIVVQQPAQPMMVHTMNGQMQSGQYGQGGQQIVVVQQPMLQQSVQGYPMNDNGQQYVMMQQQPSQQMSSGYEGTAR